MYAVIETGGKQYQVSPGIKIRVEKLEVEPGSTIEFEPIAIKASDGKVKFFTGKVVAEVVKHAKGKKLIVFKFRAKKNYKRWRGHRQWYTELLIKEIKEV
ncbi:50S ribosomal protein L21 [Thermocrinis minervae]|uniref:Large ribosomal subunit protein bL21 n=1 Tax=Thermocrinis minervae TaxID=381751 RepID=A0A1M6TB77_9AQUI|nr:50S ribosomal protein L21 [Thermocrinis minervae]SHK54245.1 LSU ribosomal protein L21P [Thermocrinis minervae]